MSATENQQRACADGSAVADRHPVVVIDRSDFVDRHRYCCPNGHSRWDPTNSHIWCQSCRDQYEAGEDVDPEHYEILDKKTGETIPYDAVELIA